MLRERLLPAVSGLCLGVFAAAAPSFAQGNPAGPGSIFSLPLPGGLPAALGTLEDATAPDRGQFLLELTRRLHAPGTVRPIAGERALIDRLTSAGRLASAGPAPGDPAATPTTDGTGKLSADAGGTDTLPLPLAPDLWTRVVFGGAVAPGNLAAAIIQSPGASRLYHGLLSLDDETRAWLSGQPDLIAAITARHSAAFLIAAPAFRVAGGVVRTPGGNEAASIWQALVGQRADDPASFLRSLLPMDEGRLAYFFSALSFLTDAQLRFALRLDSPDAVRTPEARQLYVVSTRAALGWMLDERPFWRPSIDPVLLVANLSTDAAGQPILPGGRRFWTAVLSESDLARPTGGDDSQARELAGGEPAGLAWLCEQVFKGGPLTSRLRYGQVLFASRILGPITPENARRSVEAVRAAAEYPSLVTALERAGLRDVETFAAASRRAAAIAGIGDHARTARSLAQYQGVLALVTRAASRGSLPRESLPALVSSLAAVEPAESGDYEGRLVRWLAQEVGATVDEHLLALLASSPAPQLPSSPAPQLPSSPAPQLPSSPVTWEGTSYRLDFAAAEAARLTRLLGDAPRPYLEAAHSLVEVADGLAREELSAEARRRHLQDIEAVAQAAGWERDVSDALARAVRETRGRIGRGGAALAPAARTLRVLADDLLARGLTTLAYAVALGHADPALITAGDASARHDFGLRRTGASRRTAWDPPQMGTERMQDWKATGSLLGLDVSLSEFLLLRLSARPPRSRPTLNESDRRVLVESVALATPAAPADADRDVVLAALERGRARVRAISTPADAEAAATQAGLSPARRTIFAWTVRHDPARVNAFLSPLELFWLGTNEGPLPAGLHAFGTAAGPRRGCLCLQLPDRQPREAFEGRWDSGMLASGFPDLNLRLTELLAELAMPAALLGPVLASATLDLVTNVSARDPDDRRALVEYVQQLGIDRVEQYLALLTTDGPLVPVTTSSGPGYHAAYGAGRSAPGEER